MASNSDRIRLAIALSALKFKPKFQSCSAYVLELQSKFPASSPDTSNNSWRTLALSLEHDFATLKGKYEAEQIRSLALENALSAPSEAMPNSSSEQPAPAKKRLKKKPILSSIASSSHKQPEVPHRDLKSILEELSVLPGIGIARLPPSHSLFSSLDNFVRLMSLPEVQMELLLSVTHRVVQAVALSVSSITIPPTPNIPSDPDTLECLGRALHHVLNVALPLLGSGTQKSAEPQSVITLLERTTTLVLNPLIHAFSRRSETYLDSLFLSSPGGVSATTSSTAAGGLKPPVAPHGPLPVDVRTDILSLFRMIFCFLDGQIQSSSTLAKPSLVSYTLRASLILETVREIDRLLSAAPTIGSSGPSRGVDSDTKQYHRLRPERAKKLAMKDSLWFLCTVLHILFGESSSAGSLASQPMTVSIIPGRRDEHNSEGETGDAAVDRKVDVLQGKSRRLLSEGVSDALVRLLTRCKRPALTTLHQTQAQSFPASELGIEGQQAANSADGADKEKRAIALRGNEEWSNLEVPFRVLGYGDKGRDEDRGDGHDGKRIDVGVEIDVEAVVDAAGQLRQDSGSDQGGASLPQGASEVRDEFRHDKPFELDEVEYGMLLGVMERYWVWSKYWEL
ncbi:hypothetical protein FPV67DRAFT_312854 [Lyophyllum atratum]|nr:hypothetical protein FPV67DRAFT_312854 [Lyophyllum atratum]